MATDRRILADKHGVTLTEVTLRGPNGPLETAYVVQCRHTPVVFDTTNLGVAEARWKSEVEQAQSADGQR